MHVARSKIAKFIVGLFCISLVNFLPSIAKSGVEEDVRALVKLVVNESTIVAFTIAKRDEITEELQRKINFKGISRLDFDEFFNLFVDESAAAMTAGLQRAFEKKFLDDMSEKDIEKLLFCHRGNPCTPNDFSKSGNKVIQELPQFGKIQGQRIGRTVGNAIAPKLLSIIEENKGNRFENPQSLLLVLKPLAK